MAVLHLNTDNFNQTVSSGKVMVDFWAPWCMPCQSLLPVIDELGEELAGKATVAKVNVDDNKAIASQFRVMSRMLPSRIPSMISVSFLPCSSANGPQSRAKRWCPSSESALT